MDIDPGNLAAAAAAWSMGPVAGPHLVARLPDRDTERRNSGCLRGFLGPAEVEADWAKEEVAASLRGTLVAGEAAVGELEAA